MKKILIATILSSIASFASADVKPYIEGSVGYFDLDSTSSSATQVKPDSDVNYGLEIGFKNIADTGLRLGGSYLYSKPDVKSYEVSTGDLAETAKYKQKIYLFNAYYDFKNSSAVTPFVGVGLGSHDYDTVSKEFVYALHGGAKYNIVNNVYVGVKGSYFRTKGFTSEGTSGADESFKDLNSFAVNATLGYEF
jgi:opacity protein-like surface antigen